MIYILLHSVFATVHLFLMFSKKPIASWSLEGCLPAWNSVVSQILYFLRKPFLIHSRLARGILTLYLFLLFSSRRAYDQYSFSVLPLLGSILAGDRSSYQYLVESIRRFPAQDDFAQMIRDAGFTTGGDFEGKGGAWEDMWGGIACVHKGVKLWSEENGTLARFFYYYI